MSRPVIRGYAAPFDEPAMVEGGVIETIQAGAFDLAAQTFRVLFASHDEAEAVVIARQCDAGALLFQDDYGLGFQCTMRASDFDVSTLRAIRREAMGCSVRFTDWSFTETVVAGVTHRTVTKARIDHIALLGRPAYDGTDCWVADDDERDLPPRHRVAASRWTKGFGARHSTPIGNASVVPAALPTRARARTSVAQLVASFAGNPLVTGNPVAMAGLIKRVVA